MGTGSGALGVWYPCLGFRGGRGYSCLVALGLRGKGNLLVLV